MDLTYLFSFFTVEDVSDLWPTVKELFEQHQPLKRAVLTNKTRNPVLVENLPVEFILTTDARLRSRFPHEQYLYWFREPYATIVLVTCEVLVFRFSASFFGNGYTVHLQILKYETKMMFCIGYTLMSYHLFGYVLYLWPCGILMSLRTFLNHV